MKTSLIKGTVSWEWTKFSTDVNNDGGQCANGVIDADDAPCNANISRIFEKEEMVLRGL